MHNPDKTRIIAYAHKGSEVAKQNVIIPTGFAKFWDLQGFLLVRSCRLLSESLRAGSSGKMKVWITKHTSQGVQTRFVDFGT